MHKFRLIPILMLSLLMLGLPAQAQQDSYSLDWNIAEGDVVAYTFTTTSLSNTGMTIDPSEDLSLGTMQLPNTSTMIAVLTPNPRGTISVNLIVDSVETVESGDDLGDAMNQLMEAMEGTIQLRGELTSEGEIASFWLEQKQLNLLSMLFEMPIGPVNVGDTWELEVRCISMGNGFIVENASRTNLVEFTEVSTTSDGRLVAVLNYLISESVEGSFDSPFSAEPSPASMTCLYTGQGRFLIAEGRWEQFSGQLSMQSSGFMDSNSTNQFTLIPLDEIPPSYLNPQ
jgi:hypothetical protein